MGTLTEPKVAIIYDWENKWIINDFHGPANTAKKYTETVIAHYAPFWERGISVDVIDPGTKIFPATIWLSPPCCTW